MFTDLNLTDMETCYKVFRREVLESITIEEDRFGFEPEITAKVARGRLARLRGRHLLQRPHLRRGQEDRLEGRRPRPLLHRAVLGGPAAPRALTTVSRIETDEGVAEVTPSTIKPRRTWPRWLKPVLLGLLFVGTVLLMRRPTPYRVFHTLPGNTGDPALVAWIMSWDVHALLTHPFHLFDAADLLAPHPHPRLFRPAAAGGAALRLAPRTHGQLRRRAQPHEPAPHGVHAGDHLRAGEAAHGVR